MKVIIATMVKNEDDIIRDWLNYYGTIFGFDNLYIIDNYSTDTTFQICEEYISKGIHLEQKPDYKLKGHYMTYYKNTINCDFFIPVDIDEFIVYKEDCDINILQYLQNLHTTNVMFKMNFIVPIQTTTDTSLTRFSHGTISDRKDMAKTFFQNIGNYKSLNIDHGNHMASNNYFVSDLYLIHFHKRSDEQHKKKIIANITGLGYKMDITELKKLGCCDGWHHVNMCIYMLEHPEESNAPPIVHNLPENSISLHNFTNFLQTL